MSPAIATSQESLTDQFFQALNNDGADKSGSLASHSAEASIRAANRRRSNSRSRRQLNPFPQNNTSPSAAPIDRAQVQYNLILVSLNGTFERKSLVVPYLPDVLKLGRPAGTKIQPTSTNGYFDSRVLSRNHAQLFADMASGKIYLKDLGSSNGTFVNDEKIGSEKDSEPTEIRKGDVIDLGFDIESHQNHRKISARVENILIRPLGGTGRSFVVPITDSTWNGNQSSLVVVESSVKNSILSNAFDSGLFGDILPSFEDHVLGIKSDSMTGLSINSNLTTSSNLDFQIRTLISEIYKTKNSVMKLKSVEEFLKKYIKNLKKIEIEKNEANKSKVKDYEQQLVRKFEKEYQQKKEEYEVKLAKLDETCLKATEENQILLHSLKKLNEKSEIIHAERELEKEEVAALISENNNSKNELELKDQELNDWKIKYTELQAEKNVIVEEKSVQTDFIKKIIRKEPIDNDSDSSTLNDDDLNLQRVVKALNAGSSESPLKSVKQVMSSNNSDEDLNIGNDNNIITDGTNRDIALPTVGKKAFGTFESAYDTGEDADDEEDLKYQQLVSKIEELKLENTSIKDSLANKEERISSLLSQLHQPWAENGDAILTRRGNMSQLSRSSSNVSISSTNIPQSPLLGLFSPTLLSIARRRSNNLGPEHLDNLTDIDDELEPRKTQLEKPTGVSGMFLKPENTRASIVTAVGVVIVGLMVSKFGS